MLVTLNVAREMTGSVEGPVQQVPPPAPVRGPPSVPSDFPLECWQQLDSVNLSEVFLQRIPMLKSCPRFLRGRLRFSFGVALRERCRAKLNRDPVAELRAWKLFGLVPIVLLHRPKHGGTVGRDELAQRADDFSVGRWADLISAATQQGGMRGFPEKVGDEKRRRGMAAQRRVERGQVSRARHELTGAALAPRTNETLGELRGRRPQERESPIPEGVQDFFPEHHLILDASRFAKCLQTAPSGSSPGPGGCTNEILKVCLEDSETLALLTSAAEDFARATVPREVSECFMLATMTALQKKDGGVRGIATGTSFRRLVAKTLARQFAQEVEAACAPFQFALSTRAGTDCVGHAVRAATEANPQATVLSIDGVGAYDHVHRSAMMAKLLEIPALRGLIPFVRSSYGQPSCYKWTDADGVQHDIHQHEGGEQGDPLMPLLFSLAIHNALAEVSEGMLPTELLFAFLDDVYVVSNPDRTRPLYDLLGEKLAHAGIRLHAGKTRMWNKASERPPNIDDLGDEVWNPEGIKVLGTPVGSDAFVLRATASRLEEESRLWEAVSWVPDAQCAWQILLQCASPRCHHFLRTVPPRQSTGYAEGHDDGMWRAVEGVLGRLPGSQWQSEMARWLTSLPMRLGGLGIRSAARTAPAAYWASWADALEMLSHRLPALTEQILGQLEAEPAGEGCLAQLCGATRVLDHAGFLGRPTWAELLGPGWIAPPTTRFL